MINVEMTNKRGVTLDTTSKYCADNIKVAPQNADSIIPENIKKDVEILGVTGNAESADNAVVNFIAGEFTEYTTPQYSFSYKTSSFWVYDET